MSMLFIPLTARYFIWLVVGSVINRNLPGGTYNQSSDNQEAAGERIIEIFLNGIKDTGNQVMKRKNIISAPK
ncbi:MAG: hypothetical protein PHS13_08340 [Firmicutes bacterium]|nr:hypothetical protein [Bacillota bacterium]MDD3297960.1 hypothetical protein [Bacillota bacterium]MDD3851608.1 hypothetical protein [Bacillota bacterium]